MLLAYIKNGNTVLFNVPSDNEEILSRVNRYDYYTNYYVGTLINSKHILEIIDKMAIDRYFISFLNNGDFVEINKDVAYRFFRKYSKEIKQVEEEKSIKL